MLAEFTAIGKRPASCSHAELDLAYVLLSDGVADFASVASIVAHSSVHAQRITEAFTG